MCLDQPAHSWRQPLGSISKTIPCPSAGYGTQLAKRLASQPCLIRHTAFAAWFTKLRTWRCVGATHSSVQEQEHTMADVAVVAGPNMGTVMYEQIQREVANDPYYQQNFPNDGQRFVAWHLRRVMLSPSIETRDDITDGADNKQMDAVVIDDESRRVVIVQGKFIGQHSVDAVPL